MSLEKLLVGIETRGREECDAIVAKADEQARALLDQARLEAQRVTSEILDFGDPELELKRTRRLGELELKRIKLRAKVKAELVERVYASALKQLNDLRTSKDYRTILTKLLEEITCPECNYIQVQTKDVDLMNAILKAAGLKREVEPSKREFVGVITGQKTNGQKEFDVFNTMQSRLDKIRDSLNIELNRVLFESNQRG